ncbi:MAG: patatin-like phospholipase family protein [Pelosinus sp.]|nr:patatin-like phospholipase family protein [Pelosinus sp.]
MRSKIGLALGSGGLRGLAHIGVLKVLERENITIDYMAGCSMGSLIGGLYSSGQTIENMIKLARHLRPRFWLDFVMPKMGVVAGDRIYETIKLLTQQKTFAELNIPLSIVATDIKQGKEIIFTEGSLAMAVRASISVPGIFIPFQYEDMLLVDGAVVNPTPMDIVRSMGADIVIAVDLAHASTVSKVSNMFDVIIQSIDIMEQQLLKHREHHCDILIRPAVGHISPSAFDALDECVALGEKAAEAALPELKALLATRERKLASDENQDPLCSNEK